MLPTPAVSVVVPCRNEEEYIGACVRSILSQEPPPGGFEVIVADGMSDDGTRAILEQLEREDERLRVIDNPGRITPCAMNAAIRAARGAVIARMDAHHTYAPDYLCRSMEVLERTAADNVGGAMMCTATTPVERAIAAAHHSPIVAGGARWHDPAYEGPADTVFGGVFRREIFERVGLFDEALVRNQDDEFNFRLTRAGGRIWQSPAIRSWYHPRRSLSALFKQYAQYGYWKVRVIRRHGRPAAIRHLAPAAFVLSVVCLTAASFFWSPAGLALSGLLGAYMLLIGAASFVAVARTSLWLWPLVSLVAVILHVAYGVGFLRGIFDTLLVRRPPSPAFTTLTRTQRPRSH